MDLLLHHACTAMRGMFTTTKRLRTATGPTTCSPKPGTKAFSVLVGHSHPSVLVTVEAFQADVALSEQLIELDARGDW